MSSQTETILYHYTSLAALKGIIESRSIGRLTFITLMIYQ